VIRCTFAIADPGTRVQLQKCCDALQSLQLSPAMFRMRSRELDAVVSASMFSSKLSQAFPRLAYSDRQAVYLQWPQPPSAFPGTLQLETLLSGL
jgi:hypothetical protein